MSGRRFLAFLIALACCAGCKRAAVAPARTVLNVATRADVTGIFPNPPYQAEVYSIDVNANVFDSLVRFDQGLRVLPALAETWENPDDATWIFQLRSGVRFSNGAPVRASDVVASLRTSKLRNTSLLPGDTVEVVGPNRIAIRTSRRSPHLLASLQSSFILPEEALAHEPVPAIGSGPYGLTRWTPGRELVLHRNPFFYGPAPKFEEVNLRVTPSASERIAALLSGRAQIADAIPPEEVARLTREPRVRVVSEPGLRVLFLAFRVDRPPFSDLRVRRAFRLAIDQKELIRRALSGQALPATQLVPPQVFGYDAEIPETRADVAAARRLLAEAGYPKGLSVRLDGPSDRYVNDVQILHEVKRQLAAAGITVTVDAMPKSRYFPHLKTEAPSFYLLGWVCNTLFGGDALEVLVRTRGPGGQGDFNYQGISEPELDRLTEEGFQGADSEARLAAVQKAMAFVSEKELVVPLVIPREAIAISREVEWQPETGLALRFAQMRPAQ